LSFALRAKPPAERRVVTHFTISDSSRKPARAQWDCGFRTMVRASPGPQRQIFVRDMEQTEAKPIPGIVDAEYLSFSPDGLWISYVSEDRLNKVAVAGGPAQLLAIATARVGPSTQRWGTDAFILFASGGVLKRVPEGGGKEVTLATPDKSQGEGAFFAPQLLPGGRTVLFRALVRARE
jgi:hypothetical protein